MCQIFFLLCEPLECSSQLKIRVVSNIRPSDCSLAYDLESTVMVRLQGRYLLSLSSSLLVTLILPAPKLWMLQLFIVLIDKLGNLAGWYTVIHCYKWLILVVVGNKMPKKHLI